MQVDHNMIVKKNEIFNFKTIYNFGLVFVPEESLTLEDKNQLCVSC